MTTEPFKGIIFLLQFMQGNAWPFSITWLKLNLQILLLDFYSFAPIWKLLLPKLSFIYPQLNSNGFPQLNTNSPHFKIYYWNRTTQIKEQKQKSKVTIRKSSLHVKLLTYIVISTLFMLFPLWLVWSFLQGLAGGKSKDTQGDHLLSKRFGPFPTLLPHALLGFALLAQACSCWQLLGFILQ